MFILCIVQEGYQGGQQVIEVRILHKHTFVINAHTTNEPRARKVISCQEHFCDPFMNSFQLKHAVCSSQSVEEKAIKKSLT